MKKRILVSLAIVLVSAPALLAGGGGSGSSLPLITGLQNLVDFLTGTVAYLVLLLGLIVTGFLWFGGNNQGAKMALMGVIGVGIAISAAEIASMLAFDGGLF